MSSIKNLLLIIPLIINTATTIDVASFNQAGSSRIPGYTGPGPQKPTSDVITNTFCYCSPEIENGNPSRTSTFRTYLQTPPLSNQRSKSLIITHWAPSRFTDYYQTDYYSTHYHETFILTQTCLAGHLCHPCPNPSSYLPSPLPNCDLSRSRTCTHPKPCLALNTTTSLFVGTHFEKWDRKWYNFEWDLFWNGHLHDHLTYYPNYKRKGSDFIEFNKRKRDLGVKGGQGGREEAEEEAERVCERLCREQIGTGVLGGGGSRQVVYGDVDDMCITCK